MNPADPEPVLEYERTPQMVPVARFADATEAHLAASRLASEEVECHLDEHTARDGMGPGWATLSVEGDQLARAVEVLGMTPARRCLLVSPALPVGQEADPVQSVGIVQGLVGRLRRRWRDVEISRRDFPAPRAQNKAQR